MLSIGVEHSNSSAHISFLSLALNRRGGGAGQVVGSLLGFPWAEYSASEHNFFAWLALFSSKNNN